jgi:hypothetical protein
MRLIFEEIDMLARHARTLPALFVGLFSALLLTGCAGRVVKIEYAPLFNTPRLDDAGHKIGLLMVYCLVAIENKDTNAVDFTFDPLRLYLKDDQKGPSFWTIKSTTVPATTTATKLGTLTVLSLDPSAPNQSWDRLYYTPIGNDSVLMVQLPANPQPLFFDELPHPFPVCPSLSSFSALNRPATAPRPT